VHEMERPRFRIGFVPSTLYGRLPELIRRYRAVRPGVELALIELTTLEQIAAQQLRADPATRPAWRYLRRAFSHVRRRC
jgi:DNA-binding transcriptional LysR family regulator